MTVQHDHELVGVVGKELPDPARMGHVGLEADAEHRFVPTDAGVDIGDGQREVVQAGGCDRHDRVPLVVDRGFARFVGVRFAWQ